MNRKVRPRERAQISSVSDLPCESVAECLHRNIERIVRLWENQVRSELQESSPKSEAVLRNSIPKFLEKLSDSLKNDHVKLSVAHEVAEEHAEQRAEKTQFTLQQLLMEYRVLRHTLFDVLEETGPLRPHERNIVLDFIQTGMAEGADKYTQLQNERLKKSEERFELAIGAAEVGIWDWDIQANKLDWTPSLQKIWGYQPGEFQGYKSFLDRIHPEDRESVKSAVVFAIQSRGVYQIEIRVIQPNGGIRWIHSKGKAFYDENGKAYRMSGTGIDITDRKSLELEHQLERNRFETVLRQMPEGVVIVEAPSGKLILANQKAEEILGYSFNRSGIISENNRYKSFHKDGSEYLPEDWPLARSLKTGEVVTSEDIWMERSDGALVPVRLTSAPIRDSFGKIVSGVLILQDVQETMRDQQLLRESEQKFRRLFESNMVGVAFADIAGGMYEANDYFLGMIGYSRKEFEENKIRWDKITPPEYLHLDHHAIEEMKKKGTATPYEKPYFHKNGKLIWVMIAAAFLDEKKFKHVAVAVDVTERRHVEERLAESEQGFRAIFELAPIGVGQADPATGKLLRVNEQYAKILGYTRKELESKSITDLLHPIDLEVDWDKFQKMVRGEVAEYQSEKRYIRKDGRTVWVNSTARMIRDSQGKPLRTIGIVHDVTERKRVEEELKESRERLQLIISHLPSMVWTATSNGVIDFCSPGFIDYSGVDPALASIEDWTKIIHPDDLPLVLERWRQGIRETKPYYVEFRLRHRIDAKYEWFLGHVIPIHDKVTGVTKWFGTNTNIDHLKRMQLDLENERELREQFVNTLTHDLRNPIAAAKTSSQLIVRNPDKPERVLDLATRTISSINRADSMIQDLLDTNRIRAGHGLSIDIDECDLSEIIKSACDEFLSIIGPRIEVSLPDQMIGFWSGKQLRRLVDNLIGNAVKYGAPYSPILVRLTSQSDRMVLSVTNFGNPISVEDQSELFQPFMRTQSALTGTTRGWGLGLTLVRGVAEAHGGTVSVASSIEMGTVFTVILPRDARSTIARNPYS